MPEACFSAPGMATWLISLCARLKFCGFRRGRSVTWGITNTWQQFTPKSQVINDAKCQHVLEVSWLTSHTVLLEQQTGTRFTISSSGSGGRLEKLSFDSKVFLSKNLYPNNLRSRLAWACTCAKCDVEAVTNNYCLIQLCCELFLINQMFEGYNVRMWWRKCSSVFRKAQDCIFYRQKKDVHFPFTTSSLSGPSDRTISLQILDKLYWRRLSNVCVWAGCCRLYSRFHAPPWRIIGMAVIAFHPKFMTGGGWRAWVRTTYVVCGGEQVMWGRVWKVCLVMDSLKWGKLSLSRLLKKKKKTPSPLTHNLPGPASKQVAK